ncbi:MAG: hypothetical protein A3J06_03330 [Candidatus Moranbacteria bacterium RIFCSPLOWO2_02_FULL_48_19]|nr:MAG: hypothetical protein A3J06_03330 [Candidatus Moranbacteria bacterium RIFCSPLOWO2_02_FULL_48_19]OGI30870.1 MAG: hypothetical protein A3G09_04245 [Candidatus Moranbacteria bacterium RIFCSPLOWO2_12_FULL_48_12]
MGSDKPFQSTLRSPDGYKPLGTTLHLFRKIDEERAIGIKEINLQTGEVIYEEHQHTFAASTLVTELPIILPKLKKPGRRSV